MHLSSLTLTNLRQFDHRTFEFQPGFNLLVGENGAGKTTILRGLLAVLGGTHPLGRRYTLEDDDIRLETLHTEVRATVQSSNGNIEEFHFRKELWKRAKRSLPKRDLPLVLVYRSNEAISLAMKLRRAKRIRAGEDEELRRSEEFLYRAESEFSRRPVEVNQSYFGNSYSIRNFVGQVLSTFSPDFQDFYWRFEPYDCSLVRPVGVKMIMPSEVQMQKQARAFAMRYFQEGWRREGWKTPYRWPDQTTFVLDNESFERSVHEGPLPNIKRIWDEMKISPEVREFLQSCSLEVKLTPRIMIRHRVGPLSLSQLSDGEQRLFSLFVDVARQLSLQNPQNGIGGGEAIVLVDEIDVHLHPKWQRKIVPALEDLFQQCQFIATTHSPFVIQATNRQKVAAIDPVGPITLLDGGNSIEDIAENIQGVSVPQRSVRAENLSDAAKQYFTLLKMRDARAESVEPGDLVAAEQKYREASEPFTSDPAVHALLKVQLMEGDGE